MYTILFQKGGSSMEPFTLIQNYPFTYACLLLSFDYHPFGSFPFAAVADKYNNNNNTIHYS